MDALLTVCNSCGTIMGATTREALAASLGEHACIAADGARAGTSA